MVESGGLLILCTPNRCTAGSNPALSASNEYGRFRRIPADSYNGIYNRSRDGQGRLRTFGARIGTINRGKPDPT